MNTPTHTHGPTCRGCQTPIASEDGFCAPCAVALTEMRCARCCTDTHYESTLDAVADGSRRAAYSVDCPACAHIPC